MTDSGFSPAPNLMGGKQTFSAVWALHKRPAYLPQHKLF